MNTMYQIELLAIKYVARDEHTMKYNRDVQEWMKQWTVGNNYAPILVESSANIEDAIEYWRNSFASAMKNAILTTHPDNLPWGWKRDFTIFMDIYEVQLGKPRKHKKCVSGMPFSDEYTAGV